MADDVPDQDGGEAAPTRPTLSRVPRKKPVIEGQAKEIDVTAEQGSAQGAPAQDAPAEDPETSISSSPEAETAPGAAEAEIAMPPDAVGPEAAETPRRAGFVWPFAAAIVLAALAALGGAFGLHRLDTTPAKFAALDARVAALEQRPDPTAALRAAAAGLEQRIAALEAASRDAQTTAAGLRADLDKLAAQKAAAPAATPASGATPDLAPLAAHIGALEEKLAALDARVGGLATRLDLQKNQVHAAEVRVTQSVAAHADSEAVAIIAASLLRKVEAGAPFTADLTALANRGLDKGKLAPLESAAATGAATASALAKQFSDVSDAVLATEPQPQENGFFDHVLQGAARLVRIRKVGDASGNDLASRVARIEAMLKAGAIETAYQEWSALPDAAKAKSQAFGEAAKNRIDAIAAARGIDADAMAALAKAKS